MGTQGVGLEMVQSRLFAPYFGTSLFVWGAVIGTVLIALSLGYYYGGKLADKKPQTKNIFLLGVIGSIIVSIIGVVFDLVFQNIKLEELIFGSFDTLLILLVISLVFFAIPIVIFSMIVPYAVRVIADNVDETGKYAGNIFAFSTMGSILGVFIPSFITIPYLGVRETLFSASAIGLALSLYYFRKKWSVFLLLLIPIIGFYISQSLYLKAFEGDILVKESQYQLLRVTKQENPEKYELKINAGLGIQSEFYPDQLYTDAYFDSFSVLPYLQKKKDNKRDVLILGMAGGSIPIQMRKLSGEDFEYHFTGVELDPGIEEVAKEIFHSEEEYIVADARQYLITHQEKKDMIVVDAYGHEAFIPAHLASVEFFNELQNNLNDEGVVVININAPSKESSFYQAFTNTFASAFPYSYSVKANDKWNYLIIGSKNEIDFNKVEEIANTKISPLNKRFRHVEKIKKNNEHILLTDNKSNIDYLTAKMFFEGIQ